MTTNTTFSVNDNTMMSLKGTYRRYHAREIPAGEEARQVSGGPMVPGPWAYTYGLCSVISTNGGTADDIREAKAKGLWIEIQHGDLLRFPSGNTYRVDDDFLWGVRLVAVEDAQEKAESRDLRVRAMGPRDGERVAYWRVDDGVSVLGEFDTHDQAWRFVCQQKGMGD